MILFSRCAEQTDHDADLESFRCGRLPLSPPLWQLLSILDRPKLYRASRDIGVAGILTPTPITQEKSAELKLVFQSSADAVCAWLWHSSGNPTWGPVSMNRPVKWVYFSSTGTLK